MEREEDIGIKFIKIALDDDNYVYGVFKYNYPYGVIKYLKTENSFIFGSTGSICLTQSDFEEITNFIKSINATVKSR
jgi:hypothetical protein